MKHLQQFNQVIIIMGVYSDENKFVIVAESKSIRINLPIKINESQEHDTKFIVSRNKSLTEYIILGD